MEWKPNFLGLVTNNKRRCGLLVRPVQFGQLPFSSDLGPTVCISTLLVIDLLDSCGWSIPRRAEFPPWRRFVSFWLHLHTVAACLSPSATVKLLIWHWNQLTDLVILYLGLLLVQSALVLYLRSSDVCGHLSWTRWLKPHLYISIYLYL